MRVWRSKWLLLLLLLLAPTESPVLTPGTLGRAFILTDFAIFSRRSSLSDMATLF
jgi:hypothetical protein